MSEATRLVNARTIAYCRGLGWDVMQVDWFDRAERRWHDFLGIGDFIAMTPDGECVLIQATSDATGGNSGARVRKITGTDKGRQAAAWWLRCPNHRLEVWAWKKNGDPKVVAIIREMVE